MGRRPMPKKMPVRRAYAVLDALADYEGEVGDALSETGESRHALHAVCEAMRHIIDAREAGK